MLDSEKGIAVLHEKTVKCWTDAGKQQLHTELWPQEHPHIWPLIDFTTFSV